MEVTRGTLKIEFTAEEKKILQQSVGILKDVYSAMAEDIDTFDGYCDFDFDVAIGVIESVIPADGSLTVETDRRTGRHYC